MKMGFQKMIYFLALLHLYCAIPSDEEKEKKESSRKRCRAPTLSVEDYKELLDLLLSGRKFSEIQGNERRLYRMAKYQHGVGVDFVSDPFRGEKLHRLTRDGRILLPADEVDACIKYYYQNSGGDGAAKLANKISNHYFGISKNRILSVLNPQPTYTQPNVTDKHPPQLMSATQKMERHQIDLVYLSNRPVEMEGKIYLYVLSILDCYTRFLWLRPIADRQTETIVRKLEKIYFEFGTPKFLYSDRGTEFLDAFQELSENFKIKIIHSELDCPRSEGKMERSHNAWETKLGKLLSSDTSVEQNWVEMLPYLAHSYNIARHPETKRIPYEVMFSVKPNTPKRFFMDGHFDDIMDSLFANYTTSEELHENQEDSSNDTSPCKRRKSCSESFMAEVRSSSSPANKTAEENVNKTTPTTWKEEFERNSKRRSNLYTNINRLIQVVSARHTPQTDMQMLFKNAQQHGLVIDSDNAGGGNCLFLAISQQLRKHFGIIKTHEEIRKEIVYYLLHNPYLGSMHLGSFVSDYPSWDAYLDALSQDGTWGDHLALIGAANLYHISISIISSVEGSNPIIIDPEDGPPVGDITLGHVAEMHYVTLQSLKCEVEDCPLSESVTDFEGCTPEEVENEQEQIKTENCLRTRPSCEKCESAHCSCVYLPQPQEVSSLSSVYDY